MPVLSTMGSAAARNYGFFGAILKPLYPAGTFGIVGAGNAVAIKYTFANDISIRYTDMIGGNTSGQPRASIANVNYGLFLTGGNTAINTCRYIWSTGVAQAGSNTPAGAAYNCGCSNSSVGLVVRGFNGSAASQETYKYSFSGNTWTTGSGLGVVSMFGGACGTSTFGMINIGNSNTNVTMARYEYATDIVTGGTNLNSGSQMGPAFGNTDKGIYTTGNNSVTIVATQKYTWASNIVVAGGNLVRAISKGWGMAANTYGLSGVFQNPANATQKYSFASDTTVVGGTLANGVTANNSAIPNGQAGVSA